MKRDNRHIEIANFFISSDAHILRGLLEAEGITVFLFNEGYASLTPADAIISGGIKLHIPFDQKERAERSAGMFLGTLTMATVFYFAGKWSLSLEKSRAVAVVKDADKRSANLIFFC